MSASILEWILAIGILIFAIAVCVIVWYYKYYYNLFISIKQKSGNQWITTIQDKARRIKMGRSGLTLIYLRKAKVYRLLYKNMIVPKHYVFYRGDDGYDYPGYEGGDLLDENFTKVVTTHPLMRSQYTALEYPLNSQYARDKTWMEKYGGLAMMGLFSLGCLIQYLMSQNYASAQTSANNAMAQLSPALNGLTDYLKTHTISNGISTGVQSAG